VVPLNPVGYAANEEIPVFLPLVVKLHAERPERYTFTLTVQDREIAHPSVRFIQR